MNKKGMLLIFILIFTTFLVSACSIPGIINNGDENKETNAEEENNQKNEDKKEESNNKENNDNMTNEENEEGDNPTVQNDEVENDNDNFNNSDNNEDNDLDSIDTDRDVKDSNFADQIQYMEDETEGTARVLHETDKSQEHDMEDVSLTLEGYTFIELDDFHKDYSIPFDDESEGAVIITEYTMQNDSDDDVSFMPNFNMTYSGAMKDFDNDPNLLPIDEQLTDKITGTDDFKLKAGDEVSGYYTYPIGGEELDNVLEKGETEVEIAQPQEDPDDYKTALGDEKQFSINLNGDSSEEAKETDSEEFYEDKTTIKNLGDKKMIDEAEDIGDVEELRDVDVTLEGYQFTEFEPSEEIEDAFENFDEGAVLVTVKFDLDNNGEEEIGKYGIDSTLTMNNGKQYTTNQAMLLNYKTNDTIEPGDEDELLQVYAIDQEQYEKIWKDKDFEIEIGPMRDKDAEDISKGHTVEFNLK